MTYAAALMLTLPEPMLARSGPLPTGNGWRYELKCDGFRALVCTAAASAFVAGVAGT